MDTLITNFAGLSRLSIDTDTDTDPDPDLFSSPSADPTSLLPDKATAPIHCWILPHFPATVLEFIGHRRKPYYADTHRF
ncbi:MAG: hypothetical protein ACOX52_00890 [Verrucomicrobiota bacterium]